MIIEMYCKLNAQFACKQYLCSYISLVTLYLAVDFIEHVFYYYIERMFDLLDKEMPALGEPNVRSIE